MLQGSLSSKYRIDDVEDDSVLRRGVPAAHHIYGTPQTINCANYVYFLALSEITKLNNSDMITIYTGKSLLFIVSRQKHSFYYRGIDQFA
jgi:geranylgeranyl diphosphate synthase type 3